MAITAETYNVAGLTLIAEGTSDQNLDSNVVVKTSANIFVGGALRQTFPVTSSAPLEMFNLWLGDDLYADCAYAADGVDEEVEITVDATGGKFTIVARTGTPGETRTEFAFDADATDVESDFANANPWFASVTVTGGPGDDGGTTPYVLTFSPDRTGDCGSISVLPYDSNSANPLTGTGTATVAITTAGTDPTPTTATVQVLRTGV